MVLRPPHADNGRRVDGFRFHEEVGLPDRHEYLWGNAAFAFGTVLMQAFAESGWLASFRGVRRGRAGGGQVEDLPTCWFETDRPGLVAKPSTEVVITDALDKVLGDLGFLPLCWCQDTNRSAFHSSQSIQQPRRYDEEDATVNARLSTMLQNIFCASRFAHYIKVMVRDRIGTLAGPEELEDYLGRWLLGYTMANDSAPAELKARHPLRDAKVEIKEVRGSPGKYHCRIFLRPHFQLEQLAGTIRLETRIGGGQT
jgi:type VI secretion system protein ImpD